MAKQEKRYMEEEIIAKDIGELIERLKELKEKGVESIRPMCILIQNNRMQITQQSYFECIGIKKKGNF